MDAVSVPVALAERLGPEATDGLITLFECSEDTCVETVLTRAVDRFERRLTDEVGKMRLDMMQGHAALHQEIANQKFDLLKWSFLFWIGQVVALAGVISMLLRASGR